MLPSIVTVNKQGRNVSDIATAEFNECRKVFLIGEITEQSAMDIVLQLDYLSRVSDEPITMVISSGGGSVSAGFAIIDAMKRSGVDIITVVTGLAASMAAVIASCGTKGKRRITPYAEMMIHQPLGGISGQATDIENSAHHIVATKKRLSLLLSDNTGKPLKKILSDCERDYYLTAQEAISYGLADGFFESEELSAAV
ncbi:MAG: ClpP family protease [Oscillospiraceae bacterium]